MATQSVEMVQVCLNVTGHADAAVAAVATDALLIINAKVKAVYAQAHKKLGDILEIMRELFDSPKADINDRRDALVDLAFECPAEAPAIVAMLWGEYPVLEPFLQAMHRLGTFWPTFCKKKFETQLPWRSLLLHVKSASEIQDYWLRYFHKTKERIAVSLESLQALIDMLLFIPEWCITQCMTNGYTPEYIAKQVRCAYTYRDAFSGRTDVLEPDICHFATWLRRYHPRALTLAVSDPLFQAIYYPKMYRTTLVKPALLDFYIREKRYEEATRVSATYGGGRLQQPPPWSVDECKLLTEQWKDPLEDFQDALQRVKDYQWLDRRLLP